MTSRPLSAGKKDIDGTGFTPDPVDLWRPNSNREALRRIQWSSVLSPKTTCTYYTDGSKQQGGTFGCAFLPVVEDQIVTENQFRLTYGAEVYAAEVHVFNEDITNAHHRGRSELEIYSDSRSPLQALYGFVPQYKVTAEIKDLIKTTEVEAHMH